MFVIRTRGVVAATLGVMALGACADPDQNTNLRPEGPPDVLAVLVMSDAATHLYETATYCRPNDDKRPGLVGLPDFTTQQVCPATLSEGADEVTNAYPDGWYVRIMFDELLDPNIEELVEILDEETGEGTDTFTGTIANTRPVTLQCESASTGQLVNVAYDGYYSPSGNKITWPVGPSLVIKPNDPTLISTNTKCQVTINENVTDKSGTVVPADQRGPFKFSIAPIEIVLIDPPDDPDGESPIDARQIYFDNVYFQFNTVVDISSLCPDTDGSGLCDGEKVFSIKDAMHPDEGPGYCNNSGATCGVLADCPAGMGDTVCGRGVCNDLTYAVACNKDTDCGTGEICETHYAYELGPFGLTFTEYGLGPWDPIETDRSYVAGFTPGAKLKDRCGRESTLAPTVDNMMVTHFKTNKFAFKAANIVTMEVASPLKKLQYNFTNILEGADGARLATTNLDVAGGTEWVITPAPKKGTPGNLVDMPLAEQLITSADGGGSIQLSGFLALDTEYTATIKANAIVKDFYGEEVTFATDTVIKWKTQPKIQITSIGVRNDEDQISVGDLGEVGKLTPTSGTNIILTFNQAMDTTTLEASDFAIEPAVTGLTFGRGTSPLSTTSLSTRDCAEKTTACRLRINGVFRAGDYKFTLKAGAKFKDVFGVEYTQEKDQVVNFTVKEAPPVPVQCL